MGILIQNSLDRRRLLLTAGFIGDEERAHRRPSAEVVRTCDPLSPAQFRVLQESEAGKIVGGTGGSAVGVSYRRMGDPVRSAIPCAVGVGVVPHQA